MQSRPAAHEYGNYYSSYIELVPNGDIRAILIYQHNETIRLLANISEKQSLFRYASGKWSIKDVIGHIADTERIMSYRLLCIARGETESFFGYDDELYVKSADYHKQSMQNLVENLSIVRQSTLSLLKSLDVTAWSRHGIANDSPVTVRALAYIIAGHELHHLRIIQERYHGSSAYPVA